MIVCNKRLTRFEEYVKMLKISPIEVQNLAAVLKLITCILILKLNGTKFGSKFKFVRA